MLDVVWRDAAGAVLPLDLRRWSGPATTAEQALLARLDGPVLDVGCGPGRLVGELVSRGIVSMGVDTSVSAVSMAVGRGWPVLRRSVFERLPGEGRWATVLLIDGNIGIGGDPLRLLQRCGQLAAPSGRVVVELADAATPSRRCTVRLERPGEVGPWFPWAVVGPDALDELGRAAGFAGWRVDELDDGRLVGWLHGYAEPGRRAARQAG